jgi:hypothetical protein
VARRIGARQTYLVHMTHSVLHAETEARLQRGSTSPTTGSCWTCRASSWTWTLGLGGGLAWPRPNSFFPLGLVIVRFLSHVYPLPSRP